MANSILNLAKVKSRKIGHIYNVQSADALQNGFVVFIGDRVTGENEIYTAVKPLTADLTGKSAHIIFSDEILYDESTYKNHQLGAFSIPANTPTKAYELNIGDVVEISYDGLTLLSTDAVVGNVLIAQNNSFKLAEATTAGTNKTVLKIEEVKTVGTMQYVGSNGQVGNQYKMVVARVLSV
jgi:hypothetical protein